MIESETPKGSSRREFLLRLAKASASIAATGWVAWRFRDRLGPRPATSAPFAVQLPDFSIPGLGARMSIVKGPDRRKTVSRAFELLGGIEHFIRKGDCVLIKVNAGFATPPALGATTHPDLLEEVARLCLKAGAASVGVTDNPVHDPGSCFDLTGLGRAAKNAGATVWPPSELYFRPITLPGGTLIRNWPFLYSPFEGVTKLIGMAPVKDHHRAGASMAIKNWYGLLGGRRNVFHQNIHDAVKELALLVKPTLVILDGTMTMITNGPTGGSLTDLKPTNTMIVSTDQVAADALGATLLGRTAAGLPYITKAAAAGAGTANYEMLNPVRANTM